MQTTPNLGLKKPETNDTVNIADLNYNADVLDQEVVKRIVNAGNAPSIQAGLDASKPAPGTAGRLYVATDTQIIYRDTGSAWAKVGVVKWGDIDGKPATFPPSAHTHAGSDITSKVSSASAADTVPWTGVSGKPSSFTPSAHKSTHASGGADALAPGDIGAAAASDVPLLGASNQVVNLFKALNQQIDTRNIALSYDANGRLSTVTEKDGATTVKTTSLSYDASGRLSTVTEQVANKTITITLNYDASDNLTSVARSVA